MKRLRYVLLLIVLLFGFNAYALRISHFESTFEMDEEFNNDQIVVYLGYRGEYADNIELRLEYDKDYLENKGVYPADNFKVTTAGDASGVGKKDLHYVLHAEEPTNEVIYVAIKFEVKKKFGVHKSTEIKVHDVIATNSQDNLKYRTEGYYVKLKRESNNSMLAVRTDITEQVKRERFIISILPFIIIGVILIVVIIVVILMIPARNSEDRKRKVNSQLDSKNFPIPGVGPLPSMKKKTKRDVIEPEEKVIQPLASFVSKSNETNEELMNKGLEVDHEMFKDNPTKSGEQGLININPLAFDDGEDVSKEDDDDIDTL